MRRGLIQILHRHVLWIRILRYVNVAIFLMGLIGILKGIIHGATTPTKTVFDDLSLAYLVMLSSVFVGNWVCRWLVFGEIRRVFCLYVLAELTGKRTGFDVAVSLCSQILLMCSPHPYIMLRERERWYTFFCWVGILLLPHTFEWITNMWLIQIVMGMMAVLILWTYTNTVSVRESNAWECLFSGSIRYTAPTALVAYTTPMVKPFILSFELGDDDILTITPKLETPPRKLHLVR
jgi:hypothetical protein